MPTIQSQHTYDPNYLLDFIVEHLNLKNDAALSRVLRIEPSGISKIRHRKLPIGASLLLRMHDATEISIRELRAMMGDYRRLFGAAD